MCNDTIKRIVEEFNFALTLSRATSGLVLTSLTHRNFMECRKYWSI